MFIDFDTIRKNEPITICMNGHSKTFRHASVSFINNGKEEKLANIKTSGFNFNDDTTFNFTIHGDKIEINY